VARCGAPTVAEKRGPPGIPAGLSRFDRATAPVWTWHPWPTATKRGPWTGEATAPKPPPERRPRLGSGAADGYNGNMHRQTETQAPARRPIVPHEASATVRRRERRLALGTIGIILVLGTATTILVLAGRLQVATGPASAGRIAAEASAWLLVVEFYLYGLHRLLHTARLFRSVHRLHHLSSAPTAWTALALHPVEALAAFGIFPLLVAVHPVHPATIALVSVFMISALLATHVNHDPLPKAWHRVAPLNWLTTPLVHVGHHANARINFGAATTIPDRVFATHRVDLSYYDPRREASLPAGSRGW